MTVRIGSLFSGIGGLDMAVEEFFGGETVWHCEFDPEPSKVLAARWPGVPNLGDVTSVDWSRVEPIDILCGGFPCQDLSLAGRRAGMRPGTRSGLWSDFVKAIDALRPSVVVIENVRGLLSACAESEADSELGLCPRCVDPDSRAKHAPNVRALGRVLGDLAALGFDAEWHGLFASDIGAPHGRFRVFVLAYARGVRLDKGWRRDAGEAAGRWASALVGGRDLAPVTLLPTPAAMNPKDGEGVDTWMARRERVKATAKNGNGMGMPLAIAVQLLPTPTVGNATGGNARRGGARSGEKLLPGLAVEHATDWGEYGPGVRRWEALTRPAPAPTLPDGRDGNPRVAAAFEEWMMGYPEGHITDIIARKPALKACGNGVVPQQAYAALDVMWPRVMEARAA